MILRWLLLHEALRLDEPGNEVGTITNETLSQSLENLEEQREWYIDDRKQTPPWFPEHIRIVTSLGGDACQETQNAVHRPGPDGGRPRRGRQRAGR